MEIILYAIPGFFILIGLELIAEKVRGTDYYRVNDALTSLATGVLSQLQKIVSLMVPFTIYIAIYKQYSLYTFDESVLVWVVAFITYDFFYYWAHRYAHEINILWASHVLHHSSEEYNLTTALRQTSTGLLSFIFFIPMAIIGFEPLMVATVGAVNLVYQYWVHTQHIGKLGWYERFFVTPSNHRVHHAQNAVYIDRNYGGVFILWDRWFGTFQNELDEQPVIFGIRGALKSWNPLWANAQFYVQLFNDFIHTKNWWYKTTIWFRRTGWRPPDVVEDHPLLKTDLNNFHKFDTDISTTTKIYTVTQYVINVGITLGVMLNFEHLTYIQQLGIITFVMISSFSMGAMLENKSYAPKLEFIKNVILFVVLIYFLPNNLPVILGMAVILSSIILLIFGSQKTIGQTV